MEFQLWLLIGATLLCALVGSAQSQTIQKWKTPDGTLYFGDKPPAGSMKIGEEGSNEPPSNGSSQESAPRSAEQERLSIDVSRERTEIEKALNSNAERLEEVDKQIAEVQRAPNVVPPWMERRADFKNEKAETLRELWSQKRTTLATIADLWKRFDKLDAKVKKAYDGKAPDWWRTRARRGRSAPLVPTPSSFLGPATRERHHPAVRCHRWRNSVTAPHTRAASDTAKDPMARIVNIVQPV